MPTFPIVTPRAALPGAGPVVQVSPEAAGAPLGRSLARLGGTLTQVGADRLETETRLRQATAVTEHETAFGERIAAWRQGLARETDPDAIREAAGAFFGQLDGEVKAIADPVVRQAVTRQVATWALAAKVDASGRVFSLEVDRARAAGDAAFTHLERQAIEAPDEPTRTFAIAQLQTQAADLVTRGARTAEWAETRLEQARSTIAKGRAVLAIEADPEAAERALAEPTSPLGAPLTPAERVAFREHAQVRAKADRETRVRAESLAAAAPILAGIQSGQYPTLDLAIAAADQAAGPDAARRDATVARVKTGWADHQASEAQRIHGQTVGAFQQVEQDRSTDGIPSAVWREMTVAEREAAERRSRQLQEGREPITDARRFLAFVAQPPAQLARISEAELWARYRPVLDNSHWERVVTLWTQARESAAHPDLTHTLSWQEQLRTSLVLARVLPADKTPAQYSTEEAERAALFEQRASQTLEAFERTKGHRASFEERQQVLDDLLLRRVVVERRRFGVDILARDVEVPAVLVRPDDRRETYVPIGTIPEAAKTRITNLVRAHGWPAVTTERLERAYAAALAGDDARVEAILRGE